MTPARLIQIPDPVHGYIPVEARFMDIVDTPQFQRLRSIEQGSFRPAYPGARHDRFIHSLGTYHLATEFVGHFFRNLEADQGIRLDPAEEAMLRTTFRYAALLHDVGHAPFSHTTENLFREDVDPATGLPVIWEALCDEVDRLPPPADPVRFRRSTDRAVGGAHEIMSALLLLRNHAAFTRKWDPAAVEPELAVRMIIGYPYKPGDVNAPVGGDVRAFGIRNCLIDLLNSKVMDVDRMDYLGRDTQMSGFVNAPVDLDCLARSVTAVEEDGWLVPAFREEAINVIDTMFHAKLSHDAWVLAQPAGAYDAALREHCIRTLDQKKQGQYISKVFTAEALGVTGVTVGRKTYRLLCDADIFADLKAQAGKPFDELFTRLPGRRRTAAWRSYFEYRYLFDDPASGLNADMVYDFFADLIAYMDKHHLFEFNAKTCARIRSVCFTLPDSPTGADLARAGQVENMHRAAEFLDDYLRKLQRDAKRSEDTYSVVLLKRTNNYTMTIDPAAVRIRFTNSRLPLRTGGKNYATFRQLRNLTRADNRSNNYFYLYRHGGLGGNQLSQLRQRLAALLAPGQ